VTGGGLGLRLEGDGVEGRGFMRGWVLSTLPPDPQSGSVKQF